MTFDLSQRTRGIFKGFNYEHFGPQPHPKADVGERLPGIMKRPSVGFVRWSVTRS